MSDEQIQINDILDHIDDIEADRYARNAYHG